MLHKRFSIIYHNNLGRQELSCDFFFINYDDQVFILDNFRAVLVIPFSSISSIFEIYSFLGSSIRSKRIF